MVAEMREADLRREADTTVCAVGSADRSVRITPRRAAELADGVSFCVKL